VISKRVGIIAGVVTLAVALTVGIVVYRVKDPSPTAAPPSSSTSPSSSSSSSSDDESPSSSSPSASGEETSTSFDEDATPTDEVPPGDLPGDLTPNVVEDECLLTASEFEVLTGQTSLRAENTELAGGGRRSCFYAAEDADSPLGRVDVYASVSLTPPVLVTRIAANGAGRSLTGVGSGAVVVEGQSGTAELVVASPTLLIVLTMLPGGTSTPPSDEAWTAAGATMVGRLPA